MDVVVIVTGASAGIGLAAVRLIGKQGAKVAVAARSQERLQKLSQELPNSFAMPAEMSDAASVEPMITAVHEHYGRIDALINNAGPGLYGLLEKS
jgi:NADP-dependent 3-hydroxy acid dehydrogenase YdfG